MGNLKLAEDILGRVPYSLSLVVVCSHCYKVEIHREALRGLSEKQKELLEEAIKELNSLEVLMSPEEHQELGTVMFSYICDCCNLKIAKSYIEKVSQYGNLISQCKDCYKIWIGNSQGFEKISPEDQQSLGIAIRLLNNMSRQSRHPDHLKEAGFEEWSHGVCHMCLAKSIEPKAIKEQERNNFDQCYSPYREDGCPYSDGDESCCYKELCGIMSKKGVDNRQQGWISLEQNIPDV